MRLENHPDQPEWLSHVNASVLKVKLAMAIIGISSIHLLKTFIGSSMLGGLPMCGTQEAFAAFEAAKLVDWKGKTCSDFTTTGVMWQTIIHAIFILSAIGIAYTDKLMQNDTHKARAAAH
jgi:uncharacterized protein (TIGR00645 family)